MYSFSGLCLRCICKLVIYKKITERKKIMFFKKSKARRQVVDKFNEIQVNLENNYKDLAILSRKELEGMLEELHKKGELSETDYSYYKNKADDLKQKMEGYDHTNISKFLKERY